MPLLAALLAPITTITPAAATTASGSCQEITQNVALGPNLPFDQTIKGTFCTPLSYVGQKSVDVLIHGATYTRDYWDWPTDAPRYSYVKRTQLAGRATFAYDRLGAGKSSRPPSNVVNTEADAYVLHQLIHWLHTTKSFSTVDLVGHSYGSIVAINETATYNDASKLIVTGLLHTQTPNQPAEAAKFYPAIQDPQFAGQPIDADYLTTIPDSRGSLFYSSNASPAVIAHDEATKDVVSSTQFQEGLAETFAPAASNISQNVHIPVFVIVGDQDALFCGGVVHCNSQTAIHDNEAPYYINTPSFHITSIAHTGHDLALHPTADVSFLHINTWVRNN